MRIRKTKGTAVLTGNVVDSLKENSTTNAPSQRAVKEAVQNNIMTAFCKSRFSLDVPAQYTTYVLPLTDSISCGDKLTFENHRIKIGKGVSKVLVSGSIGLWNSPSTGEFGLQIHKNGNVRLNMAFSNHSGGEITGVNAVPVLAEVEEGDLISLSISSAGTGTHNFLTDDKAVSLTVQVVD